MNIAEQNDLFRTNPLKAKQQYGIQGQFVVTEGVEAIEPSQRLHLFHLINEFKDFNEDNDPYGEHDFGKVEHQGHKVFWKIDYYDTNYKYGSPAIQDPMQTRRVLTIMLAEEY